MSDAQGTDFLYLAMSIPPALSAHDQSAKYSCYFLSQGCSRAFSLLSAVSWRPEWSSEIRKSRMGLPGEPEDQPGEH